MDADERRRQFESDCEKHHKHVYRRILGKIRNATAAQELTQQTILHFLKTMEGSGWEKEIADVGAYLNVIATNLCTSWLAGQWRELPLESDDDEQGEQTLKALRDKAVIENDPTSGLENDIYYWERFRSLPLHIILGGLTENELHLLRMNAVEELSADEIAKELGMDVKRVRYQLNKLFAKLRYRARRLS